MLLLRSNILIPFCVYVLYIRVFSVWCKTFNILMPFVCAFGFILYTFKRFVCNPLLHSICWCWKSTHLPLSCCTASKQYLVSGFNYRFAGVYLHMTHESWSLLSSLLSSVNNPSAASCLSFFPPLFHIVIYSWIFNFNHLALNDQNTICSEKLSPCCVFSSVKEILLQLSSICMACRKLKSRLVKKII